MAAVKFHIEEPEEFGRPPDAGAPGGGFDYGKILEIALKLGRILTSGFVGTFSTWTPLGTRWVTFSDKPPA